ncbi:DUF2817 domain-containing protein [Candidatus Nomurabacteria bacterium]|nr:DUF2817 domain-containing protein [Candidatus Kaiserbacteria bacterium]MCB9815470.1 DUF2817 domain-containing protein [Candidatus Nomurabacteria bacterium]
MNSKNIVIGILVLVLIGAISYLLLNNGGDTTVVVEKPTSDEILPVEPDEGIGDGATPIEEVEMMEREDETNIGTSVNGDDITAYHFGTGDTEVLLVGGTHGSYSPNTSALANEAVEYFQANPDTIPEGVMLTIIPNLNPDGLAMTGTQGRFNVNNVDLNRNFDCEWSAEGVWRDQKVSGGSSVFSEPEAQALRNYVETYDPNAAIVLFSAEGKVYPSACEKVPNNASVEMAATYATAAGYPAEATFDAYPITGDMVNWMAKQGIPAISVLLTDYKNTEWTKNKAGIEAVLKAYAE